MELVKMKVEFWSTSFAAPKPPNRNLLIKLIGNYPPIPLLGLVWESVERPGMKGIGVEEFPL
jgi:hypothetical protein